MVPTSAVVKISMVCACLSLAVVAAAQTRVPRKSSLTGRIVDSASNPISANITVYRRNVVDGSRALAAISSTHNDADGSYRCERLPSGIYIVAATPDTKPDLVVADSKSAQRSSATIYGRTFYPSTNDLASADLIHLSVGQQEAANIVLHASQNASLQGKISGSVVPHSIRVLSHSVGGDLPVEAAVSFDSAREDVRIGDLPAGSYTITANSNVRGSIRRFAATATAIPGKSQTIAFAPVSLHQLNGTMQVEAACPECKLTRLELRRVDEESTWSVMSAVGKDGSFSFPAATDGDYVLSLPGSTSAYVQGVTIDGKHLSDDVIHLRGDVESSTLLVHVAKTLSAISGKLDAANIVDGRSGVVLEELKTGAVTTAKIDALAQFDFDGLGPGQYRIYAWRDLTQAEYRNHNYLHGFENQAVTISVDDSASKITDIEPHLIP